MKAIKVYNEIVFQSDNLSEVYRMYNLLRNSSWRNSVFLTKI